MLKTVRIILFDWGGTLAAVSRQDATREPCARAVVAALRGAGHSLPDEASPLLASMLRARSARTETPEHTGELESGKLLEDWANEINYQFPEGAIGAELVETLWTPWVGCLDLFEAVPAVLRKLRRAGMLMGLVSNCAAHPSCCRAEVQRQGIAAYLGFTLFSSELGVRKPHASIYREALHRASQRIGPSRPLRLEEVLFVGDTPEADIAGPKRLGMQTALVRTGNWRGDVAGLVESPDLILDSVADLCAMKAVLAGKPHTGREAHSTKVEYQ